MHNGSLIASLTGSGVDTWTLWLKIMATGTSVTLSALLALFTAALYRNRDRETPVALHFTLANLFASLYVACDIAVRLDLLTGHLSTVMVPYRLALTAIVLALAALMALERVLHRRGTPWRRLLPIYLVALAVSALLWLNAPWLIIASPRYEASASSVLADYGNAAAPFFVLCLLAFATTAGLILHRARVVGGEPVWRITVFGFTVFFLAGVHDTLRELGLDLLSFNTLPLGCAAFQFAAFAAMTLHYSHTLDQRAHQDRQLRRLEDRATRDPLSGLFNRAHLERYLEDAGPQAAGALLFVDLDHFKTVNDRFGHDLGDRLILAVADCLRATLREGDIACRWGGDEFVIYLANADAQAGPRIEGRLLRAFADVRLPAAPELTVSASMGFARLTDGDWRRTLQRADQALYRSKASGRQRLTIAP